MLEPEFPVGFALDLVDFPLRESCLRVDPFQFHQSHAIIGNVTCVFVLPKYPINDSIVHKALHDSVNFVRHQTVLWEHKSRWHVYPKVLRKQRSHIWIRWIILKLTYIDKIKRLGTSL